MRFRANREPVSISESISLEGKKTIVTGAASGIGEAICYRFAESGSDLLLVDIDGQGLERVKVGLGCFKIKVQVLTADLSIKAKVDELWVNMNEDIPDILVNNSGIYPPKDYLEIDEDFYEKVLRINLDSVFWMCQRFIKARGEYGGIIVNTSSIEAIIPFKDDMIPYSVSKSGVCSLTRSLAHDYGSKGFRINGIIPGVIKTPGIKNQVKKALREVDLGIFKKGLEFKSRLPIGRLGEPDEVAKVVLFLCSGLASYIQGAMIPVDGGFLSS